MNAKSVMDAAADPELSRSESEGGRSICRHPVPSRRGPAWLETAVIYQVYPQSFCDASGDGIGDLEGLISKLDYISSLGCNVVWLNPCFDSPFGDAGYDIRDFYKVAPRYGTNADMKRLFREAKKRDLRVVLDLVAGHTSTDHPWFKQSALPEPNPFTHRYIWTDKVWKEPGAGFESVKGFSDRDGQYVTNFFHFQPALNFGFANPDPAKPWQLPVDHPSAVANRQALWDILDFWLGMGADGFRVDMAFSLVKNDPEGLQTAALWREIREKWDARYPEAALLSEWSNPAVAIDAGFHVDFMIHFGTPAYTNLFRAEKDRDSFGMTDEERLSIFSHRGGNISSFLDIYLPHWKGTRMAGYISIPTGNHDIVRISKGRSHQDLKVVFAFLLTMPGTPCIYYGDEIGMAHIEGLPSKEGAFGRVGARTPMQWSSGRNAGFSTAQSERLYLPVDSDPGRPNVEAQEKDENSLLHCVRSLIRLRRTSSALSALGDFEAVQGDSDGFPFAYWRISGKERFLIVINPSADPCEICVHLPDGFCGLGKRIGDGLVESFVQGKVDIRVPEIAFAVFEMIGDQ